MDFSSPITDFSVTIRNMRIGVDLGGTKIEAIVLSDDGTVCARKRIPSPQNDYAATISTLASVVDNVARDAGCPPDTPVGIGIPGAMSSKTGLVKNANSTWLIGHPFDRDMVTALARPVRVANDANCFALSEATDGAGQGQSFVFGVILGTGVGGGMTINGKIWAGRHAIAGEWGHNPLPWPGNSSGMSEHPGPACYCGKNGCIETFLSGPALQRDHALSGSSKTLSPAEVSSRATEGEVLALQTLDRYTDRLARALAMVINVLDPDVIVCGGGVSNITRIYEAVPRLLPKYVFSDDCTTPILPNQHGDSSGVRGAAWLWPKSLEDAK